MEKEYRTKIRFNAEEATQFILDLPSDSDMSDLDELSGDEGVNDFNEDENVYNEDPEHHSDTETESLRYCIFLIRLRKRLFSSLSTPILKGTIQNIFARGEFIFIFRSLLYETFTVQQFLVGKFTMKTYSLLF